MSQEPISTLLERELGPPIDARVPSAEYLAAKQGTVPDTLLEVWKSHGFAGYANGLFWHTDPDDLGPLAMAWRLVPRQGLVFARDAFANLFILDGARVHRFTPHLLDRELIGDFDIFHRAHVVWPESQRIFMWVDLFNEAVAKHGPPAADECYGFFPAIGMGGDVKAEYVKKVKLREHLVFLAQL